MTALDSYLAALTQGMSVVAECYNTTEAQLVAAGCPAQHARELHHLAQIYFGECRFRRIQTRARTTTHDLVTLLRIEHHVGRVKNTLEAWRLRELLCTTPADQIDQQARQHRPTRPASTPGARLRRGKNLWSVTITDRSSLIADLWKTLDTQEPAQSLLDGGAASTLTTHVIIPLPRLAQVVHGDGDIELRMGNGAVISGAEFVQRRFTQHGFVTLIHPVTGPINLYRTSRVANWKQRIMLAAEHHTCAWPGCHRPVEECQIHHIVPWKHGGNTNIDNLVPLCPYHNGINDDDREGRRGHITRINGKIEWVPPWAHSIIAQKRTTTSPTQADPTDTSPVKTSATTGDGARPSHSGLPSPPGEPPGG